MLLGPGGPVRGGGTRPQSAGAPGHRRAEKPPAEGAHAQGQALLEERPQGCAKGRAGGPGASGEAEGRREDGGTSPQHNNAGGAAAGALHQHGHTPEDATLTGWQPGWSAEGPALGRSHGGGNPLLEDQSAQFE